MAEEQQGGFYRVEVIASLFGVTVRRVQQLTQEGIIHIPSGNVLGVCVHHRCQGNQTSGGIFQGITPEGSSQGQEPCDSFFLRSGISPTDGANLRKLAIQLSMTLRTGIDFFLSLSVFELREIAEEVADIGKQQQRAGTRH